MVSTTRSAVVRALSRAFTSMSPWGHMESTAAAVMRRVLDLNPKVILINMHFQAGMCDLEAKTIKLAFEEAAKTLPIIARFKGRRADEAVEVLKDTPIYVTQSFKEACDMAVSKL